VISWRAQYPWFLYRGEQRDEGVPPYPGARFVLRWWNVVSWWRARRMSRSSDLLVFPYVTPFLAVPQWFMAMGSRRVAAMVHNALPHERMPFERSLAKLAMGNVQLLVTHGEGVADDIRSLGITADIEVVSMPPTLEVEPSPLPERPPLRLLFFGYVRPYKGLKVAIASVAHLVEVGIDVSLDVVGDFWEPVDEYMALIESLHLEDRVHLRVGYVADDELGQALADHHIVVAPYLEDSLSGVVPLAFGAGRPVVSTLVRGVAEQVDNNINGVLVAPGDPVALAEGLMRAAEDLTSLAKGAAASSTSWGSVAKAVTKPFE
jgi:glycosyltransferase involved in cell wall biosynthesis